MQTVSTFKRIWSMFIIICLILSNMVFPVHAATPATPDIESHIHSINTYLQSVISRADRNFSKEDDWSWMNIGLAENKIRSSYDDLPEGYDLYKQVAGNGGSGLDASRLVLSLTGMGVDCTKLDQYRNADNDPIVDINNDEVTDLVARIYDTPMPSSTTSYPQDPVFRLLALDSGNYAVPENAESSRGALLEWILDHFIFGTHYAVDGAAMAICALAPYLYDTNYSQYHTRIQAKLDEGLQYLKGKMTPGFGFQGASQNASGEYTTAAESSAWVIMALCSLGINPAADAPFASPDGNFSTVQYLWDNFKIADGERFGFVHTIGGSYNQMATDQGSYGLRWYLNFLESGTDAPYFGWYHMRDFTRTLTTDASIESFSIENTQGTIDNDAKTITVMLPKGMDLTNITPEYTLSEGAKLESPSFPITFSEGVPQSFTVSAEDGTKTVYEVTVHLDAAAEASGNTLELDTAASSMSLKEENIAADGTIERTYTAEPGKDATKFALHAESLSYGATVTDENGTEIKVDGSETYDFSQGKTLIVTSEDGRFTQKYFIKVENSVYASITGFSLTIDGETYEGVINEAEKTININGVPADADITNLTPSITFGVEGTTSMPTDAMPQDFSTSKVYTVRGEGLLPSSYTVSVNRVAGTDPIPTPSEDSEYAEIKSFSVTIAGNTYIGSVDHGKDGKGQIIIRNVPEDSDLTSLTPDIELAEGTTKCTPLDETPQNFLSPVVYTVSGEDLKSAEYTVVIYRAVNSNVNQSNQNTNTNTNTSTNYSAVADQMWDRLLEESQIRMRGHQESRDPSAGRLQPVE